MFAIQQLHLEGRRQEQSSYFALGLACRWSDILEKRLQPHQQQSEEIHNYLKPLVIE
jgi:hypothetical protein